MGKWQGINTVHKAVGDAVKWIWGLDTPEAEKPPDPEAAQKEAEEEAKKANEERRKRIAAGGSASTVNTSLLGLTGSGSSRKKTLLGE